MLFSIIIPNLNSPIIDRTINSLENQNFKRSEFEIIVMGMDTPNLIPEVASVHFFESNTPLSPAKARNIGSSHAKGDILVFLDADCITHPTWLSTLARRFEDPSVSVVGGGITFPRKNYWTLADNLSMFHAYLAQHPPGTRALLPSLNLAIRKTTFDALGGFDERYPLPAGEDADLSVRLRQAGHTLHFEPRARVAHHPPRNTPRALLLHAYYQGKYSIKVDPRYPGEGLPPLIRSRAGVLLFSPVLATGATLRIFRHQFLRKYWYTFPAIWLAKMAWCAGAAKSIIGSKCRNSPLIRHSS